MGNTGKTFYQQALERISRRDSHRKYLYIQIRQSKAFMDQYYGEKIELDKIAASAFMSRFHFIRMFQQVYGVTPRHYLRDVRLSRARKLLMEGAPVTGVCLDVGYESMPTFSLAFKRGTGYSPKEFQILNNSNRE